jgi:hypothetical protein
VRQFISSRQNGPSSREMLPLLQEQGALFDIWFFGDLWVFFWEGERSEDIQELL